MRRSLLCAGVAVMLVVVVPAGCSGRSVGAFCEALLSGKAEVRSHIEFKSKAQKAGLTDIPGDPVAANALRYMNDDFGVMESGVGYTNTEADMRTYFDSLAETAPEEIRFQAEIVAEGIREVDSETWEELVASQKFQNLNMFARENCGEDL